MAEILICGILGNNHLASVQEKILKIYVNQLDLSLTTEDDKKHRPPETAPDRSQRKEKNTGAPGWT